MKKSHTESICIVGCRSGDVGGGGGEVIHQPANVTTSAEISSPVAGPGAF